MNNNVAEFINEIETVMLPTLNNMNEVTNKCHITITDDYKKPLHYEYKDLNVSDNTWYQFSVVDNIKVNSMELTKLSEKELKGMNRYLKLLLHNSEIFHKLLAIAKNQPGEEVEYLDVMLFKYSDGILKLLDEGEMLGGPGDLEYIIKSRVGYEECVASIKNSEFKIIDNKIIAPKARFEKMFRHFIFLLQTNTNGGRILDYILSMEFEKFKANVEK